MPSGDDRGRLTALYRVRSLTALCSVIYLAHDLDGNVVPIKAPSPASGLYIRACGGELTKVAIPPDCLELQTGEALEVAPAGGLRATLAGSESVLDQELGSRETFVLFMQPDTSQVIGGNETFGSFSKKVFF